MAALCTDVGLLAEEDDPSGRCQPGNVPQSFSHLALAQAATNLARASKPAERCAHGQNAADDTESD